VRSAGGGRCGASAITPGASRRRAPCAPPWSTCCRTGTSTALLCVASPTRARRARGSRAGRRASHRRRAGRRWPVRAPGWPLPAGSGTG
jgi:hypothetical protein